MSLQKLLGTPRGALYKNVFPIKRRPGDMAPFHHVLTGPPKVRVSFTEKMLLGIILNVGMWFIPAWVVYHMPEYHKVERSKYMGQ